MDIFLPQQDELSKIIQEKAVDLYNRLKQVQVDKLGLPAYCVYYYKSSHGKRLFFSIETSAHLLYRSVQLKGKSLADTVIMDYGAGVGSLYLLAKLIGCHTVIYNDHLEDWKESARLIAEAVNIHIDEYIVGDIDFCLQRLSDEKVACDIIVSRNVIEHIYKLEKFFETIHQYQPGALVYCSTTANYQNPASRLKHYFWHTKWEKVYQDQRRKIIRQVHPAAEPRDIVRVAKATRGLASEDLKLATEKFFSSGKLPDPTVHASNTCDPETGVWAEHLLSPADYLKLINEKNFDVSFAPGFWDTHYSRQWKNKMGNFLNKFIRKGGRRSLKFSPFLYVIAKPKNEQ